MNSTKSGLLGISELILGVLIIFFVLNYFNILSLSNIYPGIFGYLPHRTVSRSNLSQNTPNSSSNTPAITLTCPTLIHPCQGKDMLKNGIYSGIGFTVQKDNPIFAAISGDITYKDKNASQSSIPPIPDDAYILGTGNDKGYIAIYDFVGQKLGNELRKSLSAGDPIAIASTGGLIDFQDSKRINLIFRLQSVNGNIIPLSASDFK